jgi:riboflavin kinase/FMN adenylyltransferase
MVEGRDFNFGKDRGGNIERLKEWASASDIKLHVADAVKVALLNLQIVPVSSSLIRWLLSHGRVRDAAICLGRAYALEGKVVRGHQRGRTIGVPTANLACEDQLIPTDGVYAGRSEVDGKTCAAAVSIGRLPTFENGARQIEAHLIGYKGDLYGRSLRVELLDWTREQIKFKGVDELKRQLSRDIEQTVELSTLDVGRTIATIS